jgi:hypothetical protein
MFRSMLNVECCSVLRVQVLEGAEPGIDMHMKITAHHQVRLLFFIFVV